VVVISSLLPNPQGKDPFGEWIEIKNDGDEEVDISGYKIKDLRGKEFILQGKLKSKQAKKFFYSQTKIILNNRNEVVFLYNPQGKIVDKISYFKSYPGQIITRKENIARENILKESQNLWGRLNFRSCSQFILPVFLIVFLLTCLFFYIMKYASEKFEH